jgi:ketosteroid isomerase-like protein
LVRATEDWVEAGDEWRLEAEDLIPAAGGLVLTVLRVSIRGSGSGVPVEQRLYTVCGIRDGKIARIHDFLDRKDALEAAGLSE